VHAGLHSSRPLGFDAVAMGGSAFLRQRRSQRNLPTRPDGPSVDSRVTLAVYDSQESLQFDTLRRKTACPPLGKRHRQGRLPAWDDPVAPCDGAHHLAPPEGDNPDKAVIVVMTDGQENASREVTREGVKAALDRVKAKGCRKSSSSAPISTTWRTLRPVGVGGGKQMAMSVGTMNESMSRPARKSRAYAQSAPGPRRSSSTLKTGLPPRRRTSRTRAEASHT